MALSDASKEVVLEEIVEKPNTGQNHYVKVATIEPLKRGKVNIQGGSKVALQF